MIAELVAVVVQPSATSALRGRGEVVEDVLLALAHAGAVPLLAVLASRRAGSTTAQPPPASTQASVDGV